MLLIFKTSSVTPDFFYVFSIIFSFSTWSQSFKKICTWEVLGANVLKFFFACVSYGPGLSWGNTLKRTGPISSLAVLTERQWKIYLACSRLSVSEDDRKSERATSGISCERDPGVKRWGQTPLVTRCCLLFNSPRWQRVWNRLRFSLNKLFLRDKSGSPERAQLILQSQLMTAAGIWFILPARTLAQLASTYFCFWTTTRLASHADVLRLVTRNISRIIFFNRFMNRAATCKEKERD